MAFKKFWVIILIFAVMFLLSENVFAMTFSQIKKIGEIGFPAQAPYHGFIVRGENYNSGTPYVEEFNYSDDGTPIKTYIEGIARFDNLYCIYDFNFDFSAGPIRFGGKDHYILALDGSDKEIFKIENDGGINFYLIYHNYCGTTLNILGTRRNGNWINFIDSKKISENYFDGNEGYKVDGGIIYNFPICFNDIITIQYRRWHWDGESEPEGEFKFKWNDEAQEFIMEHIIY